MKKTIGLLIGFLFLIYTTFAADSLAENGASAPGLSEPITRRVPLDLSNFPAMFVKDGNFNAVIVVGDKAPASDVIAQSNLIQFFGGYTGKSLVGSTKLSSEIVSLKQNIISIGSACHNPISSEIMIYPNPCNKWLEPSKAMIILYDYKGYVHMVIAGYSNKGTRDAVNFLVNQNVGSLRGANLMIEINEEKTEISESIIKEKVVETKQENISVDSKDDSEIEREKEKIISELNERIVKRTEDTSKKAINPIMNETTDKNLSKQNLAIKTEQKEEKKETSITKRIINWFKQLFS